MALESVSSALLVTLTFDGEAARPYSTSESHTFPGSLTAADIKKKAIFLAYLRANTLPNTVDILTVTVAKWEEAFASLIVNRTPISGRYAEGATIAPTSNASITVGTPVGNGSFTTPSTIAGATNLDLNDPQSALNFYMTGESYKHVTRQFNLIPDVFVNDLRAKGFDDTYLWLPTTPETFDLDTVPTVTADYWAQWKRYHDFCRQFTKLAFKHPSNPAQLRLCDITDVSFRGMGKKPVGAPRSVFRGRAPIAA